MSRHLRRRLADDDAAPGVRTIHGAVMLTDVVGFTAHVEAMSAVGRHGLEEFTSEISAYIDRLVTLVLSRGGDVLCVAGDSLLCIWESADDSDESLREATRRAVGTAVAIQDATHDHPLGDGRTIQTRIGVEAGALTLTVAGGAGDQWELLTHGDTFAHVDEAERHGRPGAVTLGIDAVELLSDDASTSPVGDGLFEVEAYFGDQGHGAGIGPGTDTASGDQSGTSDHWALEFRRLTIALVRVPVLSDATHELTQDVVHSFQDIVGRYEGLTSTVTDNKGVRLLATFGTTGMAHEDDAVRAIHAIRAFSDRVSEIGTSCAAGVATGRVFHGVTGNLERRARTLAGDVINTAARLSTTAVDNVLCDQETAVAARDHYAFSVMNPIRVKGKSEPVPVFEPTDTVVARRRAPGALRGREDEAAALLGVLDDDTDVVVVSGEAGLGKSVLLDHLADEAVRRGIHPLVASADAIDRSTPFLAWTPIIHDVLGALPGGVTGVPATYIAPAEAILPSDLAPFAKVIPSLLGGSTEGAGAVDDEQRAALIPRLIAAIVSAAPSPALLIVEDAHWADAASMAVLRSLTADPHGALIVVSTRSEGLTEVREAIADVPPDRQRTIALRALTDDALRGLVADRLGVAEVPDRLVDFVQHRVAGNPYFCEQLLQSLVESGTVRIEGATTVVGELDASTIPSTLEGVIIARFDRLAPDAQRCLKAASVVGRRHHVGAVQACLDGVDARDVLDGSASGGLVVPTQADWYQFHHVIARDVVYELMTDRQRQDLHRVVAKHLTGLRHPPGPAVIGEHWSNGGEPALAVECFERAAVDALNAGSFGDSVSLLDRAARLRDAHRIEADRERVAESGLILARAFYYMGQLAECRHELESVIAMFDDPMPVTPEAHRAEQEAIEAWRAEPDRDPGRSADPRVDTMLFESYRFLVKVLFLLAETSLPIVTASLRGMVFADRLGRRLEAAAMQALVAGAYVLVGDSERYHAHADEAIAVAEGPDGVHVANHVWRMIAVARAGLGDWDGSLDASDRALAAMDPAGRNRDAGIWQVRAAVHLCAGDVERAPEAWRMTADIAARNGNAQLARWSRLDEVQTLVGSGDIDRASGLLTDTMNSLGRPTDPLGTVEQAYTTALVRSAQGRHREALPAARSVISFLESAPPSGFHFVEFGAGVVETMVAAVVAGETGRTPIADAAEETERALDLLHGFAATFPHVAPRIPMGRARLAAALGREEDVAPLLERALETAEAAGLDYDAARTTVLMLELAPRRAPPEVVVERALATLGRLGQEPWIARARVAEAAARTGQMR